MSESEEERLYKVEGAAREMASFLLSNAANFWPSRLMHPDLPSALEGLEVQMGKLLDALEAPPAKTPWLDGEAPPAK